MGTVVRWHSSSSRLVLLALSTMLAGCAASAPALPPDTTSINRARDASLDEFSEKDRALSCDDIAAERRQIAQSMQTANAAIEANRTRNEVAGYFGALFIVPGVATEGNYAEKREITALYQRQDALIKLGALKRCAQPPN